MTILTSNDDSILITYNSSSAPCVTADYNNSRAIDGDVRYNNSNFEVYSNGCWMMMGEDCTDVQFSPRWKSVLEWAEKAMEAETEEKELLEKSPALRKAKENYDMIKALIEND